MQSEHNPKPLSEREKQIFELIAQGYKNQEIAEKLAISVETAKHEVSSLCSKLGVNDRLEAALLYVALHPEKLPA